MFPPLGLILIAAANVSARVIDSLTRPPPGWRQVRAAHPTESITLRLALHQRHSAALEQVVLDVSTPGHARYGQHLTRDQVRSYTAPSGPAVSEVTGWLGMHGVDWARDHDWVTISTTVRVADALLNTTFAWYEHESGAGGRKLRTLSYSVPDSLTRHVDLVQPTTRFGHPLAQASNIFNTTDMGPLLETAEAGVFKEASSSLGLDALVPVADACNTTMITPKCLRTLYNVNYTAAAGGNLVAFASFLEQYARNTDLQSFQNRLVPEAKGQNFSTELINGGLNDQASIDDSTEANLDIQYILGISRPIPILQYSTGGRGPLAPTRDQPAQPGSNEPYLEFLTYMLAEPDALLPQTLSTSYGEEEQSVPREYAIKVCNMLMQLGARGVSVLFSSGDSGPGNICVRTTDNSTFFGPTFPAGCPYVTSVGATVGISPERAVGFSSGGFSIYHARPEYQAPAVASYLAQIGDTYSAFFNSSGRGIPDVSAQGQSFAVVDKGREQAVSGTSASAPVVAGMVALLNAARRSQALPPMGFLNPWLYQNAAAMTDVTTGAGVGCRMDVGAFGMGGARWNATVGWDPVTGLGTPKFDVMLAIAAAGVANQ